MLSENRQCNELVALMQAIQTCVDRDGWLIPCRAADFAVYVERSRDAVGVANYKQRARS